MYSPARSELRALSSRLVHEAETFFGCSRLLTRYRLGFEAPPEWVAQTALVESFALHARQLIDFLYTRKEKTRKKTPPAAAIHFFARPEKWIEAVGDEGPWVRQTRLRAERDKGQRNVDVFGEQIAHLNYGMETSAVYARTWPIMQLAAELGEALHLFAQMVPASKVVPGFERSIAREVPLASRVEPLHRGLVVWTSPSSLRSQP